MSAPPSKSSNPNQTALRLGLAVGGVMAVGAGVTLFFFNPSKYHIYPICTFHAWTGWYCPGCGATRALYALLHWDWRTALHDNALLILLIVAGAGRGLWLWWKRRNGQAKSDFLSGWMLWVVLVLAVVFGVVRNLPGFSFLAPL